MTIGERILELRQEAGLSQKVLGQQAGVSFVQISNWEKGVVRPSYTSLSKVCKALDVTPVEFWRGVEHTSLSL